MEHRLDRQQELEDRLDGQRYGYGWPSIQLTRVPPEAVRRAARARDFGVAAYDRVVERWLRSKAPDGALEAALARTLRLDAAYRAVWQAWQIGKAVELREV